MPLRTAFAFLVTALTAACAASPNAGYESRPVRIAGMAKPLAHGDCPEARRLAAEKPDLDVDRIPAPIAQKPPALVKVPAGVVGTRGAIIKADVVIDTLGRPDMKTFRIVASSDPWLSAHIRGVLPKWKFTPAELAGCKVARVYHFSATAPPANKGR
jgi:hypothetical protein